MAGNVRSNLPPNQPLRWSLASASVEFDIAQSTLVKRLKESNEFPGADGCYSTDQLIKTLYGSLHIERLRKLREEADAVELTNKITRAEYLHRGELARGLSQLTDGILQVINNSALSREEKDDILRNLNALPVVLRDVANRQTRLRSTKRNGDHEEEEEEPEEI